MFYALHITQCLKVSKIFMEGMNEIMNAGSLSALPSGYPTLLADASPLLGILLPRVSHFPRSIKSHPFAISGGKPRVT